MAVAMKYGMQAFGAAWKGLWKGVSLYPPAVVGGVQLLLAKVATARAMMQRTLLPERVETCSRPDLSTYAIALDLFFFPWIAVFLIATMPLFFAIKGVSDALFPLRKFNNNERRFLKAGSFTELFAHDTAARAAAVIQEKTDSTGVASNWSLIFLLFGRSSDIAFTLGDSIYCNYEESALRPEDVRHEFCHILQYQRFEAVYGRAYISLFLADYFSIFFALLVTKWPVLLHPPITKGRGIVRNVISRIKRWILDAYEFIPAEFQAHRLERPGYFRQDR